MAIRAAAPLRIGKARRPRRPAGFNHWLTRGAFRYRTTWVGIVLVSGVLGIAILGPYFAPYSESDIVGTPFQSAGGQFVLGTDFVGRDVLSRVFYGGRTIIVIPLLATLFGCGLGTMIGIASGYLGGWVDTIISRLADLMLAIPGLILALVLFAAAGSSPPLLVVAIAIGQVPRMARIVRGMSLSLISLDFIAAAEARGERLSYIVRRELFPNLLAPVLVEFSLRFGYSVLAVAGLAFLGFGLQPPRADWGVMINENRIAILSQPWAILVPSILIGVLTAGVALIGDGLTRALGRHSEADSK